MIRRRAAAEPIGFKVQKRQCATCIYRRDSSLNIKQLEADCADGHGGFKRHRACHHASGGVCCRGFWNRHKDRFPGGQIAQRLNMVVFVDVDTFAARGKRRPS